ncbi:hypothetical protein J8J19_23190, partial [Mycobacterium tuberculosis]|nr:hypothetical protein [Mycobacterium tuberculosis]
DEDDDEGDECAQQRHQPALLRHLVGVALRRVRLGDGLDDLVAAPRDGLRDGLDCGTRASAKPVLGEVRVPALVLNARNEPG